MRRDPGETVVAVFGILVLFAILGLYLFREAACEERHCPANMTPRYFREGCFCVEVPRE